MDKNIEKEIIAARIQYLALLAKGLDEWLINDKDEGKKRKSLINCIGKYIEYLVQKAK